MSVRLLITKWWPWLFPLLWLSIAQNDAADSIFEDYEKCRDENAFGRPNGTLVCDPEHRLQSAAVEQLRGMLADLSSNVQCQCARGCQREAQGEDQFKALLLVTSQNRMDQSGGPEALNETVRRIWEGADMDDQQCDANGMLLLYIRDKRKMTTYQGGSRLRTFSDQQIASLHELAVRSNGSIGALGQGSVSALQMADEENPPAPASLSDGTAADVRRADDNWAPVVGLSVALALTFLVLVLLLGLLLAKCCRLCCASRANGRRKVSKYYVNPMPSYKSIEPIYIVTPPPSEPAGTFAPPSGASLYGTGTFGPRHPPPPHPAPLFGHPIYGTAGPPPPPPLVQHPRSRSTTPTSTYRIQRTLGPTGGRTHVPQSVHSTPEPNKRDKVNRTQTVRSNGAYQTGVNNNQSPAESSAKKKLSPQPATIHEVVGTDDTPHQQLNRSPPPHPRHMAQPQLPFLDPLRRQEVQTKEEFIG